LSVTQIQLTRCHKLTVPSDEQSAEQLQEVNHPKARIAHRGICASPDAIFGSHTQAERCLCFSTLTEAEPNRSSAASQWCDGNGRFSGHQIRLCLMRHRRTLSELAGQNQSDTAGGDGANWGEVLQLMLSNQRTWGALAIRFLEIVN
jgi:hypothetical protein